MNIISKSLLVYGLIICLLLLSNNLKAQTPQSESVKVEHIAKRDSINLQSVVLGGLLILDDKNERDYFIPDAFEQFPVNTVEGFVFNPQVNMTQRLDSGKFYSLYPRLRYGFGNNRFQADVAAEYLYNSERRSVLSIAGGRSIEQIFHGSILTAFNNTFNTYLLQDNYLKIYERSYLEIGHAFSPIGDFYLSTSASWNERNPLSNLERYEENDNYTSNDPFNIELANTAFPRHQAFIFNIISKWQIGHYLEMIRGELESDGRYLSIALSYTSALDNILGSDVSYQKFAFTVDDEFNAGNGKGHWLFEYGDFVSIQNLTIIDYNHVRGKRTIYGEYGNGQFQLLDYYSNSTSSYYLQAHYEHFFQPLINSKRFKLKPLMGTHYLFTEAGGHYFEIGGGFDKAFGIWRADFYTGMRDGKFDSFGLRIGQVFD